MKKSSLYKIHRYLSIVCLIPVVFWCVSGLTHPIMANWFRIKPAHRSAPKTKIDTSLVKYSAKEVALRNSISSFNNLGIKTFNGKSYYFFEKENKYLFVDVKTGVELKNGSEIYATELARHYLGGELLKVINISVVNNYTQEYKVINRFLPVYKVSFNDKNHSDVFVHLPSSGLGTINDGFRRVQLWIFSNFHNWDFLGDNHNIKPFLIFTFSLLTFIVGVLGLYIYVINKNKYKKRKKGNQKLKKRNLHRYLSVPVSIFFLMFAFSGGYHAFQKFEPYDLNQYQPKEFFTVATLGNNMLQLQNVNNIKRISLVKIKGSDFYRVAYYNTNKANYYSTASLELLVNGDELYAKERANEITGLNNAIISSVNFVTKFQNKYGFINKRLPVYEIVYNDDKGTKCYVETASGIPGSLVNNSKKIEALSFIMLHKFHFLDFLGKGNRDVIITISIIAILLTLISGLRVFLQIVKNR